MIDWGDVPTWISGVSTVGALVAAVVAGVAATKLLRVEQNRDRNREVAREREHVERVVAWHEPVPSDPNDPDSPRTWGVALDNGSGLPLYQVHVEFSPVQRNRGQVNVVLEIIPPGRWLLSGRVLYPRPDQPQWAGADGLPWEVYSIGLQFTDATGRTWRRDLHGILAKIA